MYGELGRFLVPLDAPLARRWFADALYARRILGRPRLHRTASTEGIEPLLSLLEEVPGAVPSATAVYVREPDRVLGFFFEDGAAEPSVVAKAPFARLEAQTLEQMRAFLPPALQSTLPRVLRFHESRRGELLVMSMLPGRPASVEMRSSLAPWRRVDAHFGAAARWLAAFHDATRTTATTIVNGVAVPHCAMHGSFSPHNVLLDANGAIGVVGWERFLPAASPFLDLFEYAAAYGASYFHRATPEEAFQRTFSANNRVSRAVQRYIREYATRVGLPHKVLLPAFRTFSESRAATPRSAAPRR